MYFFRPQKYRRHVAMHHQVSHVVWSTHLPGAHSVRRMSFLTTAQANAECLFNKRVGLFSISSGKWT
jgi:hypothetical protein